VRGFAALVRRELALSLSQASDSAIVVLFFVIAAVLFPLGIGPEPNILARIAPGIVLATALLAALLSFDRLFNADYEDGSLDLLMLLPMPVGAVVLAKCLAHWLTTGLPLLIAAPFVAAMLRLDGGAYGVLMLAMALATPAVSLIGGLGAAIMIGARRGGVLLPLIVLPLTVPVLIFAAAAVDAVSAGLSARPHLMLRAALLLFAVVLTPVAAGAALRQAVE
jgi:heme exporter protein B